MVDFVGSILDSVQVFFLEVWLEGQFVLVFLELDLLSGSINFSLVLLFLECNLVKVIAFISGSLTSPIGSLAVVLILVLIFISLLLAVGNIVVCFGMESAILPLFLIKFSLGVLNPLLLVGGGCEDVKNSYLFTI